MGSPLMLRETEVAAPPKGGTFDYSALDLPARARVMGNTDELRVLFRRSAMDLIDIGERLIEVKGDLGHGRFLEWLRAEFKLSEPSAQRFMRVAEKFKSVTVTDLSGYRIGTTALYALAAGPTPIQAVQEAMARARTGEEITHGKAREIIRRHKAEAAPEAPAFPEGTFAVIYADSRPGIPAGEMATLDISSLVTADSVAFLWANPGFVRDAIRVVESWGATYKTCLVARREAPGGGAFALTLHDILLIATWGNNRQPPSNRRPASILGDSADAYDLIESMYAGPYLELFKPEPARAGWEAWHHKTEGEGIGA